jgi:arginyl-tRNA synthetase
MKNDLQQLIIEALTALQFHLPEHDIRVEHSKDKQHGDFSTNVALLLARDLQQKPRDLAQKIVAQMRSSDLCCKIEIAGPGFINFFINPNAWHVVLKEILTQQENYGRTNLGQGERLIVEFVSANPTGPLHVGHGRSAAYGDSVIRLLKTIGYNVHAEYYVNDAGRQIHILALSVWLRYLENNGQKIIFPTNAYQGDYIRLISSELEQQFKSKLIHPISEPDPHLDPEVQLDNRIEEMKKLLNSDYSSLVKLCTKTLLQDIEEDLMQFNVHFDQWFSEAQLLEDGVVDKVLDQLRNSGYTYEKEGALWFKSSELGDEKDRVLVRENGQPTYFATDIAYRVNILKIRGFKHILNILGADHHGYIPRIRASLQALGYESALTTLIVQFAVLYRGSQRVQMSTRSGEFITLRQLREEVGTDAARFFYVMRKAQQHMDFDLELAKSQSNENPIYYIYYAHARICSVMRHMEAKQMHDDWQDGLQHVAQLTHPQELALLMLLNRYTETIVQAAQNYEPHLLAHYLRQLAHSFHSYYNNCVFLIPENHLRHARLCLIAATAQVLRNGLNLLGIQAPEVM